MLNLLALVLYLQSGLISPQFHVTLDPSFQTVKGTSQGLPLNIMWLEVTDFRVNSKPIQPFRGSNAPKLKLSILPISGSPPLMTLILRTCLLHKKASTCKALQLQREPRVDPMSNMHHIHLVLITVIAKLLPTCRQLLGTTSMSGALHKCYSSCCSSLHLGNFQTNLLHGITMS
jgi:hypothetical protein